MKKITVIAIILFFVLCGLVYAGKEVVLPQELLLNSNKGVLISAKFLWGATAADNTCVVTYRIQNNDRTRTYRDVSFTISDTDFTALVTGFGLTMEARLETNIWQDVQNKFELVP